jgi:ribonuclease HI
LFFHFPYAIKLWCWLAATLNRALHFQDKEDIWSLCDRAWNPQCKLVITYALVNLINAIWFARNQFRFQNKKIHWKSSITSILSNTYFAGNNSKAVASSSITDFAVLKKFHVDIHPPKAPKIIEVLWHPPIFQWIKCNTDGSSNDVTSSCGGIFSDKDLTFLCCFAENTGKGSAFHAELSGATRAIELAYQNHWDYLWLESDYVLVIKAFNNHSLVPWNLRNRWNNCMLKLRNMNFLATHVYREGNHCADTLANLGLHLNELTVWFEIPLCIRGHYAQNRLGLPSFRFVHH